jgi:predicted ester cyclase
MSSNQLETMLRAYLDEVFNRHDLSHLDRYMSADLVSTWFGDRTLRGLPAWRDAMAGCFAAFPDAAFTLDDILLRRRRGARRRRGEWEGIARTGRKVSWTVIIIGRFANGKMVEDWVEYDRYKLLSQLGAIRK